MSKYGMIFVLFGRSGSGKDTICKRLLNELEFLTPAVQYTTRPMRDGEIDGKEYIFVDDEKFDKLESENKIIDSRVYRPKNHGANTKWRYGNNIDYFSKEATYLMISTPEGIMQMMNYHDREFVNSIVPIFIDIDEKTLLERTINRESKLPNHNYIEVCDRFIRDSQQFRSDKIYSILNEFMSISDIGSKSVENQNLDNCIYKIKEFILTGFLNHAEDYKNIYRLDDILSFINIKGISTQSTVNKLLDLYNSLGKLSTRKVDEDFINYINRGDILVVDLEDDPNFSKVNNLIHMYRIIYVDFVDKANKLVYPYNERGVRYSFDELKNCIGICRKTVCNKPMYEGIVLY